VSYAVNATNADDIIATLAFVKEHNIRLVIRNTGHDYLGRSTGSGAVAVWTSFLKDTSILDWTDDSYSGKALKVGAGVQGFEALAAVKDDGLVVVTGECPTVGLAGGYLQGGGHSALSTNFGLAADNTLSFEVVTAKGELVTASKTENSDLFWALSGGGGGNFGVVLSATVKAHPDAAFCGASFSITTPDAPENIFEVIDAWHAALPAIVDAGVMVIYFFGDGFLQIPALTAYGKRMNELSEILSPFFESVGHLDIVLNSERAEFGSYHQHYERYWGPLPEGNIQVGTQLFGGRLIPRAALPTFGSTARKLAEMGVIFIGVGLNVSRFDEPDARAVLPQWRTSIVQASLTLPWDFKAPWQEMVDAQRKITDEVQPIIEAATPGAGAYMNEADFQQRDWEETFYGANYEKLLAVKKKWDPEGLLWVKVGVGSGDWEVGGDGKLCELGGHREKEWVHDDL
jgi:FAD/FMN-containing dehydrogenase